ncbi:MAG: hypothetical protein FJX62_09570 [Alphaproteobacteria bacterium]|nr:hypothetical protein [Alphaproteobacteria bacterium]
MKFANVEGSRREAEPGLSGVCPICSAAMLAKCGEHRVWHWAHRGIRQCDHWWEPETSWHRNWKNQFPSDWQEVVHRAENGEKHVADVKTVHGRVVEFQRSYLKPEERRSREVFYGSMVWVVNGCRRKRDLSDFYESLRGRQIIATGLLRHLVPLDQSALLREWSDSRVGVYFDFGIVQQDADRFGMPVLWRLSPKSQNGLAVLSPVPVASFIGAQRNGVPVRGFHVEVIKRTAKFPAPTVYWPSKRRRRRSTSWSQYKARLDRARARRRF